MNKMVKLKYKNTQNVSKWHNSYEKYSKKKISWVFGLYHSCKIIITIIKRHERREDIICINKFLKQNCSKKR